MFKIFRIKEQAMKTLRGPALASMERCSAFRELAATQAAKLTGTQKVQKRGPELSPHLRQLPSTAGNKMTFTV